MGRHFDGFVVGQLECEGLYAVWVVIDQLSKMRHCITCRTTIDALGLTQLFQWEVVRLHGLLLTIVSVRGLQFALTFYRQLCSQLAIDRRMSTALHPQTDGQMERQNASMVQYVLVYDNHQQDGSVK